MTQLPSADDIREVFPAFSLMCNGVRVAYFDGPGGTQVPTPVVDAMADYLYHYNANTHWAYPTSRETDELLAKARMAWAEFFGGAADEVVFGNNMTTLTFHLSRALVRQWQPGDEVVVTELDHHANIAPWQALAQDHGIVLRWLPMDVATGTLRLDLLPSLLNAHTRLLAIGAASNILGTINDVAAAAKLAHAAGAQVFVDGVHYAPNVLPDVAALGADYFTCSVYKFYGPHVGILWGRRSLLDALDVPRLVPAPAASPEKFETGTQNHEGIVGSMAALNWLASLSGDRGTLRERLAATYAALHAREVELFAQLWNGLEAIPGVTCYGVPAGGARTGTVSFRVEGMPSLEVATALVEHRCFGSHGDFYATTAAERLGVAEAGLVRLGLAAYSTAEEVERVLAGVAELAGPKSTP